MKLIVTAIGTRMPDWVDAAWEDYARRMPADCALIIHEIKPEPRNSGKTPTQIMRAEAQRIEAAVPARAHIVALDEHGTDLTTRQLAGEMRSWRELGQDVAFIIGGPDGLDAGLKRRGNQLMRLSSLTLPHPLVRVLLAEQLYRAWTLLAGHPYHRD